MATGGLSSLGVLVAIMGIIVLLVSSIQYFTYQYEANSAVQNYYDLLSLYQYECLHLNANSSIVMPLCISINGTTMMMSHAQPGS